MNIVRLFETLIGVGVINMIFGALEKMFWRAKEHTI
jgi:hypothetical protein